MTDHPNPDEDGFDVAAAIVEENDVLLESRKAILLLAAELIARHRAEPKKAAASMIGVVAAVKALNYGMNLTMPAEIVNAGDWVFSQTVPDKYKKN